MPGRTHGGVEHALHVLEPAFLERRALCARRIVTASQQRRTLGLNGDHLRQHGVDQMRIPGIHQHRLRAVVIEAVAIAIAAIRRSEEHTSELQSLMRISYAVFCLKKKHTKTSTITSTRT